ncbi:MAG: aminotransferase class V-fold PLP-dependent enzyme [Alicyclobacillaceae bacterium]|nr:aminotransferase class V-fold PLP-dependent enzyme [Alicyclobacillaceae bacterium]
MAELNWSLEAVRDEMPAVRKWIYFNTGTTGPMPLRTVRAMEEEFALEAREGRIDPAVQRRAEEIKRELRREWAELVGAPAESIALTQNTTEGVGLALMGLEWNEGDEIITTNLEHSGVVMPLHLLSVRRGVRVRFLSLGAGEADMLEALERAWTPKTRMIAFSHVSYQTGAVLPMEEVAAWARSRGIWTLVDGAQGVGALPLQLERSGVDFYAMPGQKWLCGPEGCGALYISPGRLDEVRPTLVGWAGLRQMGPWPEIRYHEDARKFEVATTSVPLFRGMLTSLHFGRELGREAIYARIRAMAGRLRERLREVPGVEVVTPPAHAGLITFGIRDRRPEEVLGGFREAGVLMRTIPGTPWVRASVGFFNTEEELDRVVHILEQWR